MSDPLGVSNVGYQFVEGQLISQKVSQVVQAIKEYEPEIDVDWIPVQSRIDENSPAFRVVHRPSNGPEFILFFVKDESEFDGRVLKRIIANDQRNGEHTLSDFEAWEAAQAMIQKQQYLDQLEEANDIAKHVIQTRKNTYKVNDNLTIKEGIPFNASPNRGRN